MLILVFLYYNILLKIIKGYIMKIDNGEYKFERRRKRTFTPAIYMFLELILAWLILSVINVTYQVQTWPIWSHIILFIAFSYSAHKTLIVYDRQKEYKPA